jgi:hypothetical protein
MKRNIITLFIVFSFFQNLKAQPGSSFQNLITVNTISPEAASLGKFGNVPVGNFTGAAGVSIPIYEITVGNLKLPISLDYHAGGIKVDETASSVGIGWSLNGIGVITRSMVGRPDQSDYFGTPNPQNVYTSPAVISNFTYLLQVMGHQKDAEPDIFQYSVNGLSGKFIFRNDGTIMQIPASNNKISFVGADFTITDSQGNIYIFNEKRRTRSAETSDIRYPYISTWCLTKIISANSVDEITFTYESQVIESWEKIQSETQTFRQTPLCPGEGASIPQSGYHISNIMHEQHYIKEIKWRNGKVVFLNSNDRIDVTLGGLRLDGIEVYSFQNGVYSLSKKTKLHQSYFFSNVAGGAVTEKNYRLRLDAVSELDKATNTPVGVYSMTYNNTPIAARGSHAQDRWGFNNGKYTNLGLMPRQTIYFHNVYYTFGDADRAANSSQMLACTLSSIKYPTKGRSVFEYEPHQYHANLPVTEYKTIVSSLCCGTSSYSQKTFTAN